jgi:hypothetical protein
MIRENDPLSFRHHAYIANRAGSDNETRARKKGPRRGPSSTSHLNGD